MLEKAKIINSEFTCFLLSKFLANAGIKMTPVLLGWYLYTLTGSKLSLGILGLSEVLPAIIFALPAGVKVDTSDKRKLILHCLSAYTVLMMALAFLTFENGPSLPAVYKEYFVYIIVGLTGWIRAYYSPATSAIIAQIVHADDLVKAATTNSMSWLIAAISGPFIAGLLIAWLDVSLAFLVVVIFLLTAIMVFRFVSPKAITYDKGKTKTWESVMEGVKFVQNQKALLGSMGLDMFAVLFGGAVALLPVFAKDILAVGPQGFGALMSATYAGNLMALLYFAKRPLQGKQGLKLMASVLGFGICMIIFALSENFILSFLVLFLSGLFDGVSVIVRSTIFQLFVPDQMRGRVSSVNSIFINSSNELGQFESGVAASIMGTVPSVVFGGLMTVGISIFAYFKMPALKKLEY